MAVFEINDMYIDGEQLKAIIGYFIEAPSLLDALDLASMVGQRIQLFSRAKFVTQRVIKDNSVAILRDTPTGTIRKRAVFLCQASKPEASLRPHTFEVILLDPIPEMLSDGGTRVDMESLSTIDFVNNVLENLTDIHGHAFERVIGAWLSQF